MSNGIFVNVVDIVDLCTRAFSKANQEGDEELFACAKSVMSAVVLHLGKKHAELPEAVRPCYNKLLGN
jgi:hypothetical protein